MTLFDFGLAPDQTHCHGNDGGGGTASGLALDYRARGVHAAHLLMCVCVCVICSNECRG